jgi:Rieske 2Fe-2S family protein
MTIACDGGSIVPNLLLSLHPDYVTFHTLWPEALSAFDPDDAVAFWDTTNRQDW